MAGTDKSQADTADTPQPVVILVRPQLPENVGAVARAMLNCGLSRLRIVAPAMPVPCERSLAMASGAGRVLEAAGQFATLSEAVADLHRLYATTARLRGMVKPVYGPRALGPELRARIAGGEAVGLLFGPERTGLENDEVAAADALVQIPLNPAFSSLNLAQAVLLIAYEWQMSGFAAGAAEVEGRRIDLGGSRPAQRDELDALFEHLERELVASNFLTPPEKRPKMMRNLRALFERAEMTEQEVRTLRGAVVALSEGRPKREGNRRARRVAMRAAAFAVARGLAPPEELLRIAEHGARAAEAEKEPPE